MKKRTSLILVCGLPGTGKSTVAKHIAKDSRAVFLSTDVTRKRLLKKPAYSQEEKEMVYGLLFEKADNFLKASRKVVLDGTFYKEELRERARKIAEKNRSTFAIVEVVCSEKIVKYRLEERAKTKSISDADFRVYKKIRQHFEPIRQEHFTIDSGKDVKKQIARFMEKSR
jgi:hypothetical protein